MQRTRPQPLQELKAQEIFPAATIHKAVLEFLRGRDDAVVFGAHAVNAYVKEQRLTQEIDLLSTRTAKLATELRDYLNRKFRIFLLIRKLNKGNGRRIYQAMKSGDNHFLVDIRPVAKLPLAKNISQVSFMEPAELVANKLSAYHRRHEKLKADTDWRDIRMLLLTFPELKRNSSIVVERLQAAGTEEMVIEVWKKLVQQDKIDK
jgi:hypothetical protein